MEVTLSVVVFSYNHEKYICKCLDSILKQKTDFEFEILIADDCSTDETVNVVKACYGDRVCFLERKHNIGLCRNMYEAFKVVTGKYITTCSGDDYFPVDYVFQKHIDFLEEHSEYFSIFNYVKLVHMDNGTETMIQCPYTEYSLLDFLRGTPVNFYMGTIRNDFRNDDPCYFCDAGRNNEEIQNIYYTLLKGKKAIIPEVMYAYCYRINAQNYNSMHSYLDILGDYAKGFHAVERVDCGKHKFDLAKIWYYGKYIDKILDTKKLKMILEIFSILQFREILSFSWIKLLMKINHYEIPGFLKRESRLIK